MARQADVIVIGSVSAIVAQGMYAGYDEHGNVLHTADPDMAAADLPYTDYQLTVERVFRHDGVVEQGQPLMVRLPGQRSRAEQRAGSYEAYLPLPSVGARHLWFLRRNPDRQTYGLYFGPWSRLVIDEPAVTLSDTGRTLVKIDDAPIPPTTFIQRLRDSLARGSDQPPPPEAVFFFPTPTHAPAEEPLTTIEAAVQSVVDMHGLLPATPPTIRITRPLGDDTALLMTYTAYTDDQYVAVSEFLYLDRRGPVWYPDGNVYDIRPVDEPAPPMQFLYGSYVVVDGRDHCSFAGGLVTDPAMRTVAVTFSDGTHQVMAVEQGAYLVVQCGGAGVTRIEAWDEHGGVLHDHVVVEPPSR